MKFTTEAPLFEDRVVIAAEAASRTDFARAGMTVEADGKAQKITLRCTDTDKSAVVECAAQVDEAGSITVPARLLEKVAKAARFAESVTLASQNGRGANTPVGCKVTDSDRGKWDLRCLDSSAVMEIEINETRAASAAVSHDLMRDVRHIVAPCASNDEARPLLCGVETVIRKDNSTCFTATDSYRLASLDTNPTSKSKTASRAVIPPASLLSAAKHAPDGNDVTLSLFKTWASLRFMLDDQSEAILSVRLLAGDYDWSALVAGERPASFEVDQRQVVHAISRTIVMADDHSAPVMGLGIKQDSLTITVTGVDVGEAEDIVKCKANEAAADESVKFNARYFEQAIQHCPAEALEVHFEVDDSPWLTRYLAKSEAQATALVMPQRVR